jgi:predicted nucleotidyltransferase
MPAQSRIDLDQALDFLRQKRLTREAKLDRRFEQAWADARAIIELIARKYQPLRIYQWGSLLRREHFSEISDIDIAVEGIAGPERFFALYGEAMDLTGLPLDLVEIEKIHPLHAQSIRERGRLVYEKT